MKKIYLFATLILFTSGLVNAQNASYSALNGNNDFNRNLTTKAVGSTTGAGAVSGNGGASYSVPIPVPPGTNGVVPSVSIEYNSQSGPGIAGMGWNISGLSIISRTPRNNYFDGQTNPVELNANDRFALDGSRLISKSGTYGANATTYGTEVENFATVTSYSLSGVTGTGCFSVKTKDGVIMEYGKTADSRFTDIAGTTVMFWRLCRVVNPDSNYVEYVYDNSERDSRISEIRYTGNSKVGQAPYNKIIFTYKIRQNTSPAFSDVKTSYEAGSSVVSKYLLDLITVKAENQTTKTYQFNYANDNINSYLKEIAEKGSDGTTALNPTIFKYGDAPQDFTKEAGPTLPGSEIDFFSGDFDGNGKSDMVLANYSTIAYVTNGGLVTEKKYTGFKVYRDGNPSNSTSQITLDDGTQLKGGATKANYFSFLRSDFNGDGLDDILTSKIGTATLEGINRGILAGIRVYKSTLSPNGNLSDQLQFTAANLPVFTPSESCIPATGNYIFNGDFDGDGKQDFFTLLQNSNNNQFLARLYKTYNTGSYLYDMYNIVKDTDNSLLGNSWGAAVKVYVIDFNGDGQDEVMTMSANDSYQVYSYVNVISGGNASFKLLYSSTTLLKTTDPKILFGDFNGDRKTDILYQEKLNTGEAKNFPWHIATLSGNNFVKTDFTFLSDGGVLIEDDVIQVADFNDDGKTDIYHQYNHSGTSKSDVYYSTGNGFYHQQFSPNLNANYGINSAPFDLNGDGRSEVVVREIGSNNLNIISLKKSGKENLLEKAQNGVGFTTFWEYKSLAEGGPFYIKGVVTLNDFPLNNIQLPSYNVSAINLQNGIGGYSKMLYTYAQAQLHRSGKGFLGFAKVTSSNQATGIKSVSENELNPTYFLLLPKKNTTYLTAGDVKLSETTITNVFVTAASNRFWVKQTAITEDNTFEGTVVNTSNTYDNFGNITQSIVNNANIETTTTNTSYGAFPVGIDNKPMSVNASKLRTGDISYNVNSTFNYNAAGQITSKTDFNGTPKSITTTYDYSNLGNLTSAVVSTPGIPSRGTSSVYDTKGRYVESSTNALTQSSSATYDPKWGTPLTTIGIDGLTTSYAYDVFGRLSSTIKPGPFTINNTLAWDANGNQVWYNKTTYSVGGRPDLTTWHDVLGRDTKTETEAFPSGVITQTQTYDSRGNIATSEQPHKSGEPFITKINGYDEYNRVTSVNNGVLGTTTHSYTYSSGKLTLTTNSPSGTSSKVTDASGQVTSATDNGGVLSYAYYSHGGVKQVQKDGIIVTSSEYDVYGRQTKLTDANAGITTYTYNAFGELTGQTNAKGGTHAMQYNLLGQITSRTGPEGTTSYEYGSSNTGGESKNEIKKTTLAGIAGDLSQYTHLTEYTYDVFGRLQTLKETIDGTPNTSSYGYNVFGDVTSTTYPSGLVVTNAYDGNGYPTSISGAGATLYTTTDINGQGQVTAYSTGNLKSSTITYENGYPKRFLTTGVQDLNLIWDYQKGNLTSRQDARPTVNKTESFTYDNLNRLTGSTITGISGSFSTTYSSNGNIATKTDAGTYTYHATKFNAVTSVSNPSPSPIPLLQQDITYTTFMQPETVTENNIGLTYTYGADYNRIKGVTTNKQNGNVLNIRYYFSDGFEKDITSGTTRFIQYISSPAGMIAVIETVGSTHTSHYIYTDHLGSVLTSTTSAGAIETLAEQSFDAWGRRRNPTTWALLAPTAATTFPAWLYRGFTGHEMLDKFGLINMNGRMYDPVVGRVLSPDNFVQNPFSTQDYNRYSYARNNPLSYNDPDGNNPLIAMAIGAIIGGFENGINYRSQGKNFFQGFWRGAIAGAIGGLGAYYAPIGFLPGLGYGVGVGAITGGITSALNGSNIGRGALTGGSFGGFAGAVKGGIGASNKGANFWTGKRNPDYMYAENNLIEGLTPAPFNDQYLSEMKKANFKDIEGANWMTMKYRPAKNVELNGDFFAVFNSRGEKVGEAFAATEYRIWKGGTSRIFFAKAAFSSKEQLAYTMTHELGHAIFNANKNLREDAEKVIQNNSILLDNEGHLAIRTMGNLQIQTNGWQKILPQTYFDPLGTQQVLDTLYNKIETLGKRKIILP